MSGRSPAGSAHARVHRLLPWFVGDVLSAREAREVEAHLEGCAQCREEAAAEHRIRELVRTAATPRIAPHPASLTRVLERIESDERRRLVARLRRWSDAALGWLTPRRRRLLALVAVHNVALVLLVLALPRLFAPSPVGGEVRQPALDSATQRSETPSLETPSLETPNFETPSFETRSAPVAEPRVRVVFRDDVAMWEIVDLLRSLDLEVVAGPSEVGAFQVRGVTRGAAEETHRGDLATAVEALRADPRVRLVAGAP